MVDYDVVVDQIQLGECSRKIVIVEWFPIKIISAFNDPIAFANIT